MAEFRGRLSGNRGPASRLGTKRSGILASANTWRVQVEVEMHTKHAGEPDEYRTVSVIARPYNGGPGLLTLFDGTEEELLRRTHRKEQDARRGCKRLSASGGVA